jgi:hypothetical protein
MYIISHANKSFLKSLFFTPNLINLLPEDNEDIFYNKDFFQLLIKHEDKIIKGLTSPSSMDAYIKILKKESQKQDIKEGIFSLWNRIFFFYPHHQKLTKAIGKFVSLLLEKVYKDKSMPGILKMAQNKKNKAIFELFFNDIPEASFRRNNQYKVDDISFLLKHFHILMMVNTNSGSS